MFFRGVWSASFWDSGFNGQLWTDFKYIDLFVFPLLGFNCKLHLERAQPGKFGQLHSVHSAGEQNSVSGFSVCLWDVFRRFE